MPANEILGRRHCIPIIYTRGTHYEVGFDVGRTFASMIQEFLQISPTLNETFLPAYDTAAGKKIYDDTLHAVNLNFPQYIRELEGTADGAKVPFHKLFLLHLDNIITGSLETIQPVGCSTICVNQADGEILGHTEDALSEVLNNFYLVSAHIITEAPQGKWNVTEERYTSLCYAGHLPGYTMNYNHHGLIFSVNTLCASELLPGKIPRHFITRALLAAENFEQAEQIILDSGCGTADGCSINMIFLDQNGERLFYNIEMGPTSQHSESLINILTAAPGDFIIHCNMYHRLPISEVTTLTKSSKCRVSVLKSYPSPTCKSDVIEMLGDQSDPTYQVFRDNGPEELVKTIAVGIFDCKNRNWSIYADNPRTNEPIVVLPLDLKNKQKLQ